MSEEGVPYHYPVMTKEFGQFIRWRLEEKADSLVIFDGTLWHGGHVKYSFEEFGKDIALYVATDTDKDMYATAQKRLHLDLPEALDRIALYNCSYTLFGELLDKAKQDWYLAATSTTKYDVVFLDLWVNLWHFKLPERGFSIKGDGLLDMRYNTDPWKVTAGEIVNTYDESQLITMFVINSEVTYDTSKKIAQAILSFRKMKPLKTTDELNMLIKNTGYSAKVAAIIFQAIRIEVNQEFRNIKYVIENAQTYMNPGGILIILSYHSGEDRIVKELLKKLHDEQKWTILTKHTRKPTYKEVLKNKPSRSAQLRAFQFN